MTVSDKLLVLSKCCNNAISVSIACDELSTTLFSVSDEDNISESVTKLARSMALTMRAFNNIIDTGLLTYDDLDSELMKLMEEENNEIN